MTSFQSSFLLTSEVRLPYRNIIHEKAFQRITNSHKAYRIATSSTTKSPLPVDPHQIYHSLCPLPALSPVPRFGDKASIQIQAENEAAYRQLLVQGVLAVLLPTEDLENECLTSFVEQIFAELVIGNLVIGKVSEPWLIWEALIIVTRLIQKKSSADDPELLSHNARQNRDSSDKDNITHKGRQSWSSHRLFWTLIHWVFLIVGMMRLALSTFVISRSLPPRPRASTVRLGAATSPTNQEKQTRPLPHEADARTHPNRVPLLDFHIWRCIGDILEVETRMPWLQGTLSLMQWIALKGLGGVAAFDGTLDR